jgi:hypothetical protein
MSQKRDQRHSRTEGGGYGGRGQEEQEARYRDRHGRAHERSRDFGRGGSERFDGDGFGSRDEYGRDGWHNGEVDRELGRGGASGARELGRGGEEDFRDYGRNPPGGAYEHAGERGYRHGGGYGGYGRQPGEAGGGFSSGQSYASEPGWGPGYGGEGRGGLACERRGSFPGSYGAQAQRGSGGPGSYGQERYGYGREQGPHSGGRGQGDSGHARSAEGSGQGQYGQSFGEAGRTYGEQGFGQSRYGYGQESERRRRAERGPKGYQRSDERLKDDICERLMNADYIDASDVSVEVKDGKVTLEGTVLQRRMKHAIEDIVDDCIGVKDIDNKVRVSQGEERRSETNTSIGSSQSSGGRA